MITHFNISCYRADHSQLSQAQVTLTALNLYKTTLSFNNLMYFMLPNSVCILLKINVHAFYVLCGYCVFLLLVVHKLLETKGVLH
jgi:hypothetical protein